VIVDLRAIFPADDVLVASAVASALSFTESGALP
jgi:hypothetical protein